MEFSPCIFHHLDYSDIPDECSTDHPLLALALMHKGKKVKCLVDADYLDLLKPNSFSIQCSPINDALITNKVYDFLHTKLKPTTILPQDKYLQAAFPNHTVAPLLEYTELLEMGFRLYKQGIFIGLSSISAYSMAIVKNVDFISIDSIWLYSSTVLNKNHLIEHGVLHQDVDFMGATVEDLQLPHAVLANEDMTIQDALNCMMDFDFTFMPVTRQKKLVGWINRDVLMTSHSKTVGECMTKRPKQQFIKITPFTPLKDLQSFLVKYPVAFITDSNGKFVMGVATKADLARFAENRIRN